MRHLFFALFWLFCVVPAVGQSPLPTPTLESTEMAVPTPLETPLPETVDQDEETKVPDEFSSPQLSMENFLLTMALAGPLRPDQYILANRHLDLSKIPRVVREEQGFSLSQQLYSILQTLSLDPEVFTLGEGQDSIVVYRQPSGDQIELVQTEDGRWLFSARTVSALPRMYAVLSSKGRIERWHIETLNFEFLGLNGNLWLALGLLPLLAYGMGSLALMCLRMPLGRLLHKLVGLENEAQKHMLKPFSWLVASLIVWLGLSLLDIPSNLLVALTVLVKFAACASVVVAAFRGSDVLSLYVAQATAKTSTKFDDMLIPLVRRTVKTLVLVIGLLFLCQNLDIEVWSLFAGFSILGAMVALAGQDTVKNFFGSITVLLDQPFAVGDWIVASGVEGVVEEVGFRSTRIRTFHDSLITLPNSLLITATVDNYGARKYRRYSKKVNIRWNTPPEKLEAFCEGIREIVRRHPYTRKDSYQVWVNDMSDYSLQILLYVFWATPDWNTELRERHRFLIDLHRLAMEMGIEFAYPSQRVLLTRPEEAFEEDFDLARQVAARQEGRELTGQLLESSLPKDTPPPQVVD